jgi:metal-dependent amidase/aminoacylase/carboxypeptidase family protein
MSLRAALSEELPAAVALRHALHAEPELSGHEQRTAARVAAALGQPGAADVSGGRLIKIGNGDAPVIAARAELDALPIVEDTGVTWAARNGAAHACGHDVHLAALVALARGADDFSYYCSRYPSLMMFVGVWPGSADAPGLHHPSFLPPDDAVADVATSTLAGYLGACAPVRTDLSPMDSLMHQPPPVTAAGDHHD